MENKTEKEKEEKVKKIKKESVLRNRFRNDEVTDEERAQDLFNRR